MSLRPIYMLDPELLRNELVELQRLVRHPCVLLPML
jgi:hypothetical protein